MKTNITFSDNLNTGNYLKSKQFLRGVPSNQKFNTESCPKYMGIKPFNKLSKNLKWSVENRLKQQMMSIITSKANYNQKELIMKNDPELVLQNGLALLIH